MYETAAECQAIRVICTNLAQKSGISGAHRATAARALTQVTYSASARYGGPNAPDRIAVAPAVREKQLCTLRHPEVSYTVTFAFFAKSLHFKCDLPDFGEKKVPHGLPWSISPKSAARIAMRAFAQNMRECLQNMLQSTRRVRKPRSPGAARSTRTMSAASAKHSRNRATPQSIMVSKALWPRNPQKLG